MGPTPFPENRDIGDTFAGTSAAPSHGMRLLLATALAMSACAGTIDGDEPDNPDNPDKPAKTVTIEGPAVLAHVQRFANAMCTATDACTVSTYAGHSPTASRAIDILVSDAFGKRPSDNNALGDRVAEFALGSLANVPEHGVMYVIWRQRYNDGSGWDPMEDRGSITQNHYDHVHVSFEESAP
jgi:hypothetical protein